MVLTQKLVLTVTDTLNNPIITQLRTRYLETINKEANWSRKYGANHLTVVNLREQIRDIRGFHFGRAKEAPGKLPE
jgi:uncharacterized protein involved in exopolysaccharide biosynthesis